MATKDDSECPHVADQVREQIAGQDARRVPQGERGKERIVLEELPARLTEKGTGSLRQLRERPLPREEFVETQVVGSDAPLEPERQRQRVERLAKIRGRPALLRAHAQKTVSDVAVLTEDVRIGVVLEVVRAAPSVARADRVPLVGARVEVGIAGPVV